MADHLHYDQEFDAFRVAMSYFLSAMAAHCAVAILDHERWRDHSIAYDVARHCRFPLFWAALAGTTFFSLNSCTFTYARSTMMSKRELCTLALALVLQLLLCMCSYSVD
jgi:hypothetical protein